MTSTVKRLQPIAHVARRTTGIALCATVLALLGGCTANVGVGLNFGVPTSWGSVNVGVGSGGWGGGPRW